MIGKPIVEKHVMLNYNLRTKHKATKLHEAKPKDIRIFCKRFFNDQTILKTKIFCIQNYIYFLEAFTNIFLKTSSLTLLL